MKSAFRTPRSAVLNTGSVRRDKRFRRAHRLGGGERLVQFAQAIRPRADPAPRNRRVMLFEDKERTDEMAHLAAPAPTDFEMLAVDLLVDIDGARAGVGVMAANDVAAAVTDQIERLFHRP